MSPLKCTFIGQRQAGKSSLVRTYIDQTFYSNPPGNVYDVYEVEAIATNGSPVDLVIWDTSGSVHYDSLKSLWYPDTDVFVICLSVDSEDFWKNIRQYYLPNISQFCPNAPILLVGTKVDLRDDEEYLLRSQLTAMSYDQGLWLAEHIGAVEYIECSALTGTGMSALFEAVATYALKYRAHSEAKAKCALM